MTIDERITAAGRAQRIAYAEVGTTDPGTIEAGIIETVGEVATAAGVTGHWDQETDTWTSDAPYAPACDHCGHPIAAQGVTLGADDDVDTTGQDRPRCSDTACTC